MMQFFSVERLKEGLEGLLMRRRQAEIASHMEPHMRQVVTSQISDS